MKRILDTVLALSKTKKKKLYKYFNSLDEFIEKVSEDLYDEEEGLINNPNAIRNLQDDTYKFAWYETDKWGDDYGGSSVVYTNEQFKTNYPVLHQGLLDIVLKNKYNYVNNHSVIKIDTTKYQEGSVWKKVYALHFYDITNGTPKQLIDYIITLNSDTPQSGEETFTSFIFRHEAIDLEPSADDEPISSDVFDEPGGPTNG